MQTACTHLLVLQQVEKILCFLIFSSGQKFKQNHVFLPVFNKPQLKCSVKRTKINAIDRVKAKVQAVQDTCLKLLSVFVRT